MTRQYMLAALAAWMTLGAGGVLAAQPGRDIVGEYELVSSTTVPDKKWGYTKARFSIQKLDERHVALLHACSWKSSPKAVCSERYVAQSRDGGVYLQDMNTSHQRMQFDPATSRLTVVTHGVQGAVRHDVYAATDAPLTDPALVRRMKREQDAMDDLIDEPAFGHFSKWHYRNNRIEIGSAR